MNNQQPEKENPISEPKIGEIWVDTIHNELEILDIGYDQVFPRFLCKKLKNGNQCYRELNELSYNKNLADALIEAPLSNNSKVGEVNEPEGWMKSLIDCMHINEANLKHIADTGIVNGTLLIEIKRVMQAYADNEKNIIRSVIQKEIDELEAELLYQIANVNNSTVILMVNAKIQILNKVIKLIQP